MKIAVYFMFGVIALGVFAIWLFHKDTVESLRFDSDFIFTVKLRSLEVKNKEGDSVLYGDMGRQLHAAYYDHCWNEGYDFYEESCLYWRDMAKLRVSRDDNSTSSCYTLQWEGIAKDVGAEDCFFLQRYHWYGYLMNTTPPWPITGVYLESLDYYVEYPLEQTENLVPVWFGSQGVAIFIDSSFPFTLAWNVTDKRQFCITSKLTPKLTPMTLLRYTICQSTSIRDVYNVSRQHRQDVDTDFAFRQKHKHLLLPQPIHALNTKDDLPELLDQIKANETNCSFIELYDDWEGEYGNFSVDSTMVENVRVLIAEAARHNCYPILPISTFFSYKSQHFREGVNNSYFVRDRQNLVTRMIKWRGHEGAVLDVTNPEAEKWFLDHIRGLVKDLSVKALKLLNLSVPPDSKYFDYNMTHLDYTRIFYRDMASLNISLVLEFATGFIPLPVYMPIRMKFFGESGSSCLNTSIPYSLTMGMSGFPLLIADADRLALNSTTEEMFIRWLQMAIFFPVLEIPSIHLLKKKEMQDSLRETLRLRNRELLPYLTKVWEEDPELPIIRPLWWIAPDDPRAQVISDQFLVGDRLLVAPVLCEGTTVRPVYLPEGKWIGAGLHTPIYGPVTRDVPTDNMSVIPYFWRENEKGAEG